MAKQPALRAIPNDFAAHDAVREVVAGAIDDWLERTAPTEDTAAVWSCVDIAEHVMRRLENSGYRIAATNPKGRQV